MKKAVILLLCMLAVSCGRNSGINDIEHIQLLAAQGDAQSQYALGLKYELGNDVEQNPTEAMRLYRRSAEQGMADAQYRLGLMLELGHGGSSDIKMASRWYHLAAKQGHVRASYHTGRMYYSGAGELPADAKQSAVWYQKAAEHGHAGAQRLLGELYFLGSGVQQSYFHAYVWLSLAEQGGETSSSFLKTSSRMLSESDIGAAQRYMKTLSKKTEAKLLAVKT